MQTCDACGREHKGRGRLCAQCNNPGRVLLPDPGHKHNRPDQADHLDIADGMARADDEGWFYDDDRD